VFNDNYAMLEGSLLCNHQGPELFSMSLLLGWSRDNESLDISKGPWSGAMECCVSGLWNLYMFFFSSSVLVWTIFQQSFKDIEKLSMR